MYCLVKHISKVIADSGCCPGGPEQNYSFVIQVYAWNYNDSLIDTMLGLGCCGHASFLDNFFLAIVLQYVVANVSISASIS